jgi:acid phosphatase
MRAVTAVTFAALAVVFVLAVLPEAAEGKSLSWTVLGDWGFKIHYAKKIAAVSKSAGSKFWMGIGDNFYLNGVKSTHDPKWKSVFENIYNTKGSWFSNKRFEVIAGNHDYKGSIKAQLDYTNKKGTNWYFPKKYYTVRREVDSGVSVDFVYIDTTPLTEFKKKDMDQVKWLKDTLEASTATWIIVIGHHPIYSLTGNNNWMIQHVLPLLKKAKVAAYICGHHHSLQHHVEKNMHYLVVGNTAAAKPPNKSEVAGSPKTKFLYCNKAQYKKNGRGGCMGFATMKISSKNTMSFDYHNPNMKTHKRIYTGTIKNPRA